MLVHAASQGRTRAQGSRPGSGAVVTSGGSEGPVKLLICDMAHGS